MKKEYKINYNKDKNIVCKFCNSSEENMRQTLYGVYICEKCHTLFKKNDIKYDLDNLDVSIRVKKNTLETFHLLEQELLS